MGIRFVLLSTLAFSLSLSCVWAQTPGTGRVHIKSVQSYSGAALPKPAGIVVYDLAVTQAEVRLNSAALSRVRTRVGGSEGTEKDELARKVVNDFSSVLVQQLEKTGIPVKRGVQGEIPPDNMLAVQGDFSQIDDGNRARRMAVGLGAGSSKVEAHVECYLKQPGENRMLTEFKAASESSRKPGAAETMGAGAAPEAVAVVSGATELKQGAEGDAGRMAKAAAKEIKKALAAQGWTKESM